MRLSNIFKTGFAALVAVLLSFLSFNVTYATGHAVKRTEISKSGIVKINVVNDNFKFVSAGPDLNISPALVPSQYFIPDLKPSYPAPTNSPKYDNRIKSFAQAHLDRLLPQKILRS